MATGGDWGEIIDEADAKKFVGREQELAVFRQQIQLAKPDYLIFYISGQGGVGKTTLLNRYRDIAKDLGFLSADCDEQQKDIPAVLGRFASQLAEQGHTLKKFEERYRVYRQKMSEIENDPQAPQGLAALLGKTVVRAAFISGDMLPGVRKGLEYLPQEALESQASEWITYLQKKLTHKDEIALVREPVAVLAPLFFEDLNEIAKKHHILLCFENFEATRQELQQWLLHLREYRPSRNIRLLIAGRDLPGTNWEPLLAVTLNIRLDVFTKKEAEEFLDTYKISDAVKRKEILEASDRLPVLMGWFAIENGMWLDSSVATHDIVERFLRWDNDKTLRQAALLASFPRVFNVDILELLLNNSKQDISVQYVFDWLQTVPFVRQYADGWKYHDVVRRLMLQHQRQESPQAYSLHHAALADFYHTSCLKLDLSEGEKWANERWRKYTLAYVYHLLAADPIKHWGNVMSIFAIAIRKRRTFAVEIIESLCSNDVLDELSKDQKRLVELFRQQLRAVMQGKLRDGMEMLRRLSSIASIAHDAKGYMLAYQGECYRLDRVLEKALDSFDEAITFIPDDSWAIGSRGETYRLMKRYEEALADFNRAIELNENYSWAIGGRGETYRLMKRYEEALADFNRAIELNENYSWAIGSRGETYRLMKRYEEALADFNRAIELDEDYSWAIGIRGETYRLMGRYEEALADFNRAIELDETYSWAYSHRGETYCLMKRYEEALADFNRAIELDEEYTWAYSHRGETYRLLKRYEEALADFNRAIELDEKLIWPVVRRGRVYVFMGRYEEAVVDLSRANEPGQKLDNDLGLVFSYLGRYAEAEECYQRELSKEPDAAHILYNMAVIMFRWKGLSFAQEWLDKAHEKLIATMDTNGQARAFYGLGGLEALHGNNELALDYLRKAVAIDESLVESASHDIAWRNLRDQSEFQAIISQEAVTYLSKKGDVV